MRDAIAAPFRRDAEGAAPPLAGLTLVDVGCGGGLVAEPLARMGAEVTGLDPAAESIAVARAHAEATGARLAYRAGLVEDLVAEGARFDVVTALEVVEHVADLRAFVAAAAALVEARRADPRFDPQPHLEELRAGDRRRRICARLGARRARTAGSSSSRPKSSPPRSKPPAAARPTRRGVVYDLPRRDWRLSSDVSVNYFIAARKL